MRRPLSPFPVPKCVAAVVRDERGVAALYVSVAVALMFGMVGLTIDAGRLYTGNSEAKAAADASAIAAASQLDGTPTAISRATLAAQTTPLIQNKQTHGTGSSTVAVESLRFFHSLPDDTVATIPSTYETTDPLEARFVEVQTQDVSQDNKFIQVIASGAYAAATSARSVAGFERMVCRFPPLMICNPFETSTYHEFPGDEARGKQMLAKSKEGGDSAWAPGDFGLLDPPSDPFDTSSNTGAKRVAEEIARADPRGCYSSKVTLRPGAVTPMKVGVNVRFDLYENPFMGSGAARSNVQYRPARNVVKGMTGAACSAALNPAAQKMPPDTCLTTGSCASPMPTRLGDGVWDRNQYWSVNHPGVSQPAPLATATRYEVYRYELDNGMVPNNAPAGENGNPQCYSGSTAPNDSPDRRVLYLAVINCIEQGPLTGGSNPDVEVEKFAKMFITEPVTDDNIWLEFIDVVVPGADDGVLHDQVQLYR